MVGGIVIETIVLDDRVWINCRDKHSACTNPDCRGCTCGIYVERTPEARSVSEGDDIWWEGRQVFWTPSSIGGEMPFHDLPLARVGYGAVSRSLVMAEVG